VARKRHVHIGCHFEWRRKKWRLTLLHRYLNPVAVLAGSLGLLILGTMPASAAMTTCPSGTPTYFTGSTVYLGPQDSNPNVWSSPVTLYAYCGSVDTGHALSNVAVTAVMASSTGAIPQLEASVDGTHFQTLTLGFPGTALTMPPNLVTNAAGMVQFKLYAQSPVRSFLAGPDGAPQLIGLQLDYGSEHSVKSGWKYVPGASRRLWRDLCPDPRT